jgi:tetratricopeptide (TPR) repeat protein
LPEALENEIRTLRAHFWSERDPDGRAFVPLADAYLRKGDLDEAQELLEDGLGRHPDFASGHLVSARVHRARNDAAGFRDAVERLLELDEANAAGLRLKAEILEEEGDLDEALRYFRRALHLNPEYDDLEARVGRIEVQISEEGGLGYEEGRSDFVTSADVYSEGLDEARREAAEESETLDALESGSLDADAEGGSPAHYEERAGDADGEDFELGWGQEFEDSDVELPDEAVGEDPEGAEFGDLADDLDPAGFDDPESTESTERERMEELDAFPGAARDSDRGSPVPEAATQSAGTGVSAMSDADREIVLEGEPRGELLMPESESDPETEEANELERNGPSERGADSPTVTRTLGELYLRQGLTERAAEIFEELVRRRPDEPELRDRLGVIRERLEATPSAPGPESTPGPDSGDEDPADHPGDRAPQWTDPDGDEAEESVSPFAWDEAASEERSEAGTADGPGPGSGSPDGPTISTYLDDLLAWEPGAVPIEALDPRTVPIESLAPRTDPAGETSGSDERPAVGSLDDFQDWLRGLRP